MTLPRLDSPRRNAHDPETHARIFQTYAGPRSVSSADRWAGARMLRIRNAIRASRPVMFDPPHRLPY